MDKNSFEKLVKYVMLNDIRNESICLTTNPQESKKELNSTLNSLFKEAEIFNFNDGSKEKIDELKKFAQLNSETNCIVIFNGISNFSTEDISNLDEFEEKDKTKNIHFVYIVDMKTFETFGSDKNVFNCKVYEPEFIETIKVKIPELCNNNEFFNTIFSCFDLSLLDLTCKDFECSYKYEQLNFDDYRFGIKY